MGTTEILGLTLSIIDKVLDKLPKYEQFKKEQYYNLRKRYEQEQIKDFPERDDNLVELRKRELLLFIQTFAKELE